MPAPRKQKLLYYRGTRSVDPTQTRLKTLSFTPCLGAALIYSAQPGDTWGKRKTAFVDSSSVHAATLDADPKLVLGDEITIGLGEVLRELRYGKENGITHEEVLKVYNYLHKRALGQVAAGEFVYRYHDEDGEEIEDADIPISFSNPYTIINYLAKEDFDGASDDEEALAAADRLVADTFVFVDVPTVQKVATRLGFRSIFYTDVFGGGESAAEELLDAAIDDIDCVSMCTDLDGRDVPCHETVRPLPGAVIEYEWTRPSKEIVDMALGREQAASANRRRKSRSPSARSRAKRRA